MLNIQLSAKEISTISAALADMIYSKPQTSEVCNGILQRIKCQQVSTLSILVRRLNKSLAEITDPIYFDSTEQFIEKISKVLNDAGLSSAGFYDQIFEGNQKNGSQNINCGSGVFLFWSWYVMESGKIEIFSYFHS